MIPCWKLHTCQQVSLRPNNELDTPWLGTGRLHYHRTGRGWLQRGWLHCHHRYSSTERSDCTVTSQTRKRSTVPSHGDRLPITWQKLTVFSSQEKRLTDCITTQKLTVCTIITTQKLTVYTFTTTQRLSIRWATIAIQRLTVCTMTTPQRLTVCTIITRQRLTVLWPSDRGCISVLSPPYRGWLYHHHTEADCTIITR